MLISAIGRPFFLLLVSTCLAPAWANASDEELRLASGLRERRLFEQAVFVCNESLAKMKDVAANPSVEVAFAIELIRIRTDQARLAELERREEHWQAAKQEAIDFLTTRPQHPRAVLVQLQAVLVDMARVHLMQQEQRFGLAGDADRAKSLDLCRPVRSELRQLDQAVAAMLQDARNDDRLEPGRLSAEELTQLQRNIQFQVAEAGFQRAQLYGQEESLNQASALAEVMEQLGKLQKANSPGSDLWWQTQLALTRGHRLLNDVQNAQQTLDRMAKSDVRGTRRSWHQPILIEQIELLIGADLRDTTLARTAEQLLLAIDRLSVVSAELDLSAMRLLAAMYVATEDDSQRREQREQASRRRDLIDQQHGAWWGSRASQVFLTMGGPGNVRWLAEEFQALLTRADAVEKIRPMEALSALDQAAAIADNQDDVAAWRSCQVKASLLLEGVGQNQVAGERLISVATKEPGHTTSAALSLRGCWNFARATKQDSELRPVAMRALKRHLKTWPSADSANQAKLWLGRFQVAAGEPDVAAETLLSVRGGSPHRSAAVRAAVGALGKMNNLAKAAKAIDRLANEYPNDATVLIQQARIETKLASASEPAEFETSLQHWRSLARRLKPETDDWFEAKYNVAWLLNASGQREKAVQLMDYLSALPTGWAASPIAESLDRLRRELY